MDDEATVARIANALEAAIPDECWDWKVHYEEGESVAPLSGNVNLYDLARVALKTIREIEESIDDVA